MALVTKRPATMMVECEHCKKRNEISAKDLTKCSEKNALGRSRFLKYTCSHCGETNTVFSTEVFIHILRELNET